jgi:hypothetical protein
MTTLSALNRSALAATLCICLAACAGIGPPVAELTQAENSISEAERAGGQEYGAQALSDARLKLAAAQRATQNNEHEEALRLATEADVDAKLAQAQTDRGKSEASLREIDQGLNTLHNESTQDITEPTQGVTR